MYYETGWDESGPAPYDALNRLTKKTYSDTTPTVSFGYDGDTSTLTCATAPSLTDLYPKTQRTAMCDSSGASSWSHDQMGRTLIEKRLINGSSAVTNSFQYTYNLDGSMATLTYPTGRIITYTPNGAAGITAGRTLSAVDIANGVNYVTNAKYAPHGALTNVSMATSISGALTFNSRLQPLQMFYTLGSISATTLSQLQTSTCPTATATIMSTNYNFGLGSDDNGNVLSITNCRDTSRSQNFVYDSLNRISQAYSNASIWGEDFTIDPWGNMTNRSLHSGKTNFEPLNAPANTHNQLTGYGYDIAGNMVSNGSASYSYDAENRLIGTAGYTYTYDGDGERVIKKSGTTGTLYWRGMTSDPLAESDLSGNMQEEYIFFNGARVARRDVSGSQKHYYFSDHLGSHSIVTSAIGGCEQEIDFYPYGGVEQDKCGTFPQHYKFTGKERDTESGLDMFGARYYGSSLGRFMTPDWAAKPTSVPYANFGNPQSLNLYSYVNNNPTTTRDPDGHCTDPFSCGAEFAGIGTLIEPGGGTAVGAVVGGIVGAGIVYFGGKAIINSIHHSDDASNKNAPPPANSQSQSQSQSTPADPNGKKDDGGTKRTEHGQQRADEARAGDAHRDVGDVNRTINEGKQYTDSETGNNVSVRGNRVVITDQEGNEVSQFKNTRANTQQRIDSGKWVPKPKPEGQ